MIPFYWLVKTAVFIYRALEIEMTLREDYMRRIILTIINYNNRKRLLRLMHERKDRSINHPIYAFSISIKCNRRTYFIILLIMLSSVVRLRYVVAFVSSLASIVRLNDSCFFEPKLGAVEKTIMDKLNAAYGKTKNIRKCLCELSIPKYFKIVWL